MENEIRDQPDLHPYGELNVLIHLRLRALQNGSVEQPGQPLQQALVSVTNEMSFLNGQSRMLFRP